MRSITPLLRIGLGRCQGDLAAISVSLVNAYTHDNDKRMTEDIKDDNIFCAVLFHVSVFRLLRQNKLSIVTWLPEASLNFGTYYNGIHPVGTCSTGFWGNTQYARLNGWFGWTWSWDRLTWWWWRSLGTTSWYQTVVRMYKYLPSHPPEWSPHSWYLLKETVGFYSVEVWLHSSFSCPFTNLFVVGTACHFLPTFSIRRHLGSLFF